MQKPFLLFALSVLVSAPLCFAANPAPADTIGKLDSFDGTITIVRNGTLVTPAKVDVGFSLENNDQVRVSKDGQADIALDTKSGIKARLHLKASTIVTLDLSSLATRGQTAALDLLAGSISLQVEKLLGTNRLDVYTATAVMGVRGTIFSVETEVDGSVLLLTDEGKVELSPMSGASLFSVPGTALTAEEEGLAWAAQSVTDSGSFVATWHQQRQTRFGERAPTLLAAMADRYNQLRSSFLNGVKAMEANNEVWQKWAQAEADGKRGSAAVAKKIEDRAVSQLTDLRRLSWELDRVNRRLETIESRLGGDAFLAIPVVPKSGPWAAFVSDWHGKQEAVDKVMALVHFRVKLFALGHGGQLQRPDKTAKGQSKLPATKKP